MNERAEAEAGSLRRLHPSSLLFGLGATVRAFLLPALLLLVLPKDDRSDLFWAVLFLPSAIYVVAHYLSYGYRFGPDGLVVREGILTRSERNIPYSRIQNVDIEQNLLQRFLRVAEVRLETASGKEPEAKMSVVSLDAVDEIRERVFRGRGSGPAAAASEAPEGEIIHTLSTKDLVLLGLLSNRGFAIVAAALALVWKIDDESENRLERWLREAAAGPFHRVRQAAIDHEIVAIALGVVLVIVLMRVLSVSWSIIRFSGFRLERHDEDLRVGYGLTTRISGTIPRQRVQGITARQPLLFRAAARVRLRAHTAGGNGESSGGTMRSELTPLARASEIAGLVAHLQPQLAAGFAESFAAGPLPAGWHGLHPLAHRRMFRQALIFWTTIYAFVAWLWTPWVLLVPPAISPFLWLSAKRRARAGGWRRDADALWVRQGWLGRYTSAMPIARVQAVTIEQSWFDRRWDMADVSVDSAGTGGRIAIGFLPAAEARTLAHDLFTEAARHDFRWS